MPLFFPSRTFNDKNLNCLSATIPTNSRRSSLFSPLSHLAGDDPFSSTHLSPLSSAGGRSRSNSLQSLIKNKVYIISNPSTKRTQTSLIHLPTIHTTMPTLGSGDVPSYISSRSANSLISFSRPTRIQAVTLHYLNKILDELLLLILTSAKSLATDRIKSDGILKVLGGQTGSGSGAGALLAKNAVLEAELELRSYLDGQRKEGGKMPLGLSATSRWDGTDTFPVQRAYEALRVRCQYYSTLGDLEDPSPHTPQDQNIMSMDGRPIATITPGVAIYVTALLEFVAEYILQNVGKVIERDNSDEAGLSDLKKAMEEDEATVYWWDKLAVKIEIGTKEKEGQMKGGKGRVGKPWKVPNASEYDEAAGRKKFQRQSLSFNQNTPTTSSGRPDTANTLANFNDSRGGVSAMSSSTHDSRDSATFASNRGASPLPAFSSNHTDMTSVSSNASTDVHNLTRRASSDKGWFGKRRGSFRSSQDLGSNVGTPMIPSKSTLSTSEFNKEDELDGSDDFDSLIVSGGTMKVSLTPNRLRAIEVKKDQGDSEGDAKRSSRRRPGTLSPLTFRDGDVVSQSVITPKSVGQPSPAITANSRMSMQQEGGGAADDGDLPIYPPRSLSRQGSIGGSRSTKSINKSAAPPSAYRAVDPIRTPTEKTMQDDDDDNDDDDDIPRRVARKDISSLTGNSGMSPGVKLQPRNETKRGNSIRDMVDMFNSTPPDNNLNGPFPPNSSGRESRMSLQSNENFGSSSNGRKSALSTAGGKMRNLFGRKAPSSSGSIGGPARMDSMDSTFKNQFINKRGDDEMSESSYAHTKTDSPARGNTGLAIAGATGGAVALDALTMGLMEGRDRDQVRRRGGGGGGGGGASGVGMPGTLETEEDETPARFSKEASVNESYESADSKYGVPLSIPNHPLNSSTNIAVSQEDSTGVHPSSMAANNSQGLGINGSNSNPGLVGLYQEPRGNVSASELSSSNHHATRNDPPSRKIPWSYSRQSSSSRRLSGTAGPMGPARIGSGGSSGHGSVGDHPPPSAWSHHGQNRESNGTGLDATSGGGIRTPTPAAASAFTGTSPRSPLSINRPSDTARILSQLNLKMKEASSVEECRFMVTQALAAAAAAVHSDLEPTSTGMVRSSSALSMNARHQKQDSGSAVGEIPDEDASMADNINRKEGQGRGASSHGVGVSNGIENDIVSSSDGRRLQPSLMDRHSSTQRNIDVVREQLGAAPPKYRNLMLPMAIGYNANEDSETPLYKRQGDFAAWLLDGEVFDEVNSTSLMKSDNVAMPPNDDSLMMKKSETLGISKDHLSAPSQQRHSSSSLTGHSPDDQEAFESADDRTEGSPRVGSSAFSKTPGFARDHLSDRRKSNVESVRSIYRDADDGGEAEEVA